MAESTNDARLQDKLGSKENGSTEGSHRRSGT